MAGDAYIVDAVRTPIGRRNGMLKHWHPADLLAEVLTAVTQRAGVEPGEIDDVLIGCLDQVDEQGVNIARSAALGAGFPETVPAVTIDRQCGSSQQAAHFAAQGVMSGQYDIAIAGGIEVMSRVPMWANVPDVSAAYGPRMRARYGMAPDFFVNQGESGEMVADRWGLTRAECDALAAESHRRAHAATNEGRFAAEIHPVDARHDDQEWLGDRDEGIRPSTTTETASSRTNPRAIRCVTSLRIGELMRAAPCPALHGRAAGGSHATPGSCPGDGISPLLTGDIGLRIRVPRTIAVPHSQGRPFSGLIFVSR